MKNRCSTLTPASIFGAALTLTSPALAQTPDEGPVSTVTKLLSSAPVRLFDAIWNYHIATIDQEPLTPGDIFIAVAVMVFGFWLINRMTRGLRVRLARISGLTLNSAIVIEKILYYFLAVMVFLTALKIVAIPLTIFAFFGGALAIAAGFGAQQIVNNFISGLILMIEHPVKAGDVVEIDNICGQIEEIGARCTRLRAFNNIHLLIPNSKLLENTVVNWTLTDDRVRVMVSVGVAYGSPTDVVEKRLQQAAAETGGILKNPAPIILFKEFGDSALIFETHFWIGMRTMMERWKVESALRTRIETLFRRDSLTIAFPQQDVHLHTPRPLSVEIKQDRGKLL